tara:strand:+ start:7084 stop:7506 length:423 start_codon:yes stop_codon:yes gene_type:complete
MMEAYDKQCSFAYRHHARDWLGVKSGPDDSAKWREMKEHISYYPTHRHMVWNDEILIRTRRGKEISLPLPPEDHLNHNVLFGYAINELNKGELYSYPFNEDEWVHYKLYGGRWKEASRTLYDKSNATSINTGVVLNLMES